MSDEPTDAALVQEIAGRAQQARAAEALLCRRFAGRIRLYGLRHLRDEDRARDLVQAVLIALLEAARAGRITEPAHVDRYVLGICRNTALRMKEQAGRAAPLPGEELWELASVAPEAERLELGGLMACFDKLDARAREVVVLSFQEERDAAEIAALLRLTPGNVRVVRHRAIAALRRCLDGVA